MSLLMGTSINLVQDLVGNVSINGGVGNNKITILSLSLNYKV